MYCPKCGFRSDGEPGPAGCPKCRVAAAVAPARLRSRGRTSVAAKPARFSRGFKLTLASIGVFVSFVAVFPFLLPPPPTTSSPMQPFSRPSSPSPSPAPGSPSTDRTISAPRRPDATTPPGVERNIPELPSLSANSATPALLSRAKELARKHPGEAWLQQYVVDTHFWLARRRQDERRFRDALGYLNESENWGAPAGEVATYRALIYRDQNAWEPAEEWARVAIAHGSEIDPAEMHHIIGKARYFREDLDRAIEELEKALAIRDAPHIRASLALAIRDRRTSDGFSQRRLSHFTVRYEGETMEDVGRMAIDTLDRNYASLVSQLGFEPKEPVSVILYANRSYREMSGGGRHLSAGIFDGKIRLPVRDVYWGDEYIRRTLHHELSHAFFYSRTGGHDPRWLNEGLAEYVTGERTVEIAKKLAPLLEVEGTTLEGCLLRSVYNCDVFYPAAASLVDYTIQLRSMGGIRDVLSDLEAGRDINDSLGRVLGRDERSLIRDWERFVRRRN